MNVPCKIVAGSLRGHHFLRQARAFPDADIGAIETAISAAGGLLVHELRHATVVLIPSHVRRASAEADLRRDSRFLMPDIVAAALMSGALGCDIAEVLGLLRASKQGLSQTNVITDPFMSPLVRDAVRVYAAIDGATLHDMPDQRARNLFVAAPHQVDGHEISEVMKQQGHAVISAREFLAGHWDVLVASGRSPGEAPAFDPHCLPRPAADAFIASF